MTAHHHHPVYAIRPYLFLYTNPGVSTEQMDPPEQGFEHTGFQTKLPDEPQDVVVLTTVLAMYASPKWSSMQPTNSC